MTGPSRLTGGGEMALKPHLQEQLVPGFSRPPIPRGRGYGQGHQRETRPGISHRSPFDCAVLCCTVDVHLTAVVCTGLQDSTEVQPISIVTALAGGPPTYPNTVAHQNTNSTRLTSRSMRFSVYSHAN